MLRCPYIGGSEENMKKLIVSLAALLLVFSFAACTQYDYSLLYWQMQQNQSSQTSQADKDLENADIPSLFDETFNPSAANKDKVTVTYSYTRPAAMSMMKASARAEVTEIYATAVYRDFKVGGNGTISGTLYYVFEVSAAGTNYTVAGYTVYQPQGTSLTLDIAGRTYKLEVEVVRTEASGTINADDPENITADVTLTVPADSGLIISSDPVQKPSGSLTSAQMINDMLSQLQAMNLVNMLFSQAEPPVYTGEEAVGTELTSPIKDTEGNELGTFTYIFPEGIEAGDTATPVSWKSNDGGSAAVGDGITISWTGSVSITVDEAGGTQSATAIYDDFLMSSDNAPLPPGFVFSSIDGTSAVSASGESAGGASATAAYNGYTYSNEELARSALLTMLPMALTSASYSQDAGSGNLADLEYTGLSVPLTGGTWAVTADGGIDIADGAVSHLGYDYMFTLSFGAASEGRRAVESYSFGSSEPLEQIDVDIFNFIMNT